MISLLPAWARYGAPLALGLLIGWQVQAWRYGAELAGIAQASAEALALAHTDRDIILTERELRRSALAAELRRAIDENDARDKRIAAGTERVYVRAKCPAMPSTSTDAGGTGSGAAELDPAYRPIVSQLRRRAAEQLTLLNVCRLELRLRSSKPVNN